MPTRHRRKETILYYPTISVPSGKWLRQSLLYWDEIGSIVPQRYDETTLIPYTADIEFLKAEGEFRPFKPELIFRRSWKPVQEFENELRESILSAEFQRMLDPTNARTLKTKIHRDKVSREVFEFLRGQILATDCDKDWYYFEAQTALLYMAVLAKYLADADNTSSTIPGTNIRRYEALNFAARSNGNSFAGLNVSFFRLLPVPRDNNSLADILQFKRNRRDHLLRFRQVLRGVQLALSKCESQSDVNDVLAAFSNELERGLSDLEAVLKDSRIATVAGSFETLIKSSSPGWLATAIVVSGKAKEIADVPIEWALGGTLLAGTVGVARYLVDERNKRRVEKRRSPFSYLYAAKRDRII